MGLADSSIMGGGPYFKAKDHLEDKALVIFPRSWTPQVRDKYGIKDEARADFHMFKTATSLESGVPDEILENAQTRDTGPVNAIKRALDAGEDLAVYLTEVPTDKGNPFRKFEFLEGAALDKALAYYNSVQEKRQKDIDDAPDFN